MRLWNYYLLSMTGMLRKIKLRLKSQLDLRKTNQDFLFHNIILFRIDQCFKEDQVRVVLVINYWQIIDTPKGFNTATRVKIKELYLGEKKLRRKKQIIRSIIETIVDDDEVINFITKEDYNRHYFYPFEEG